MNSFSSKNPEGCSLKVLIKYLLKLSVVPFLIGLGGFIVFVSLEILYQLSDLIVRHRVGIEKLFLMLYYYLPYFVAMGVPVGVLLAIFWTFSRLSEERELMAIQVHGISQKNLIVPFLILGALLSIAVFFLSDQIVPEYQSKAEEAMSKYVLKKPEVFVVENVISKIGDDQYFYVEKYDERTSTMWNVVIFRYGHEETIITAKRVQKKGNDWYLFNGNYYTVDKDGFLKLDVHFSEMKLDITEDIEKLLRVGKTPREMTGRELKEKIEFFKKVGVKPSPWVVELHSRYANSLTPIVIVLVGVPLSLLFQLRSKSWGVIFTFVLVVLYQGSGAWLSAMGKENLLDPVLAPWIPNIVFTIVGTLLFILLDTFLAYRITEFLSRLFFVAFIFTVSSLFSSQVVIVSDRMERFPEEMVFHGSVEISYKDMTVQASEATVQLTEEGKAKKLEASGGVIYRKADTILIGEHLIFYLENEKSVLTHIRGSTVLEIEKEKKKIYLSGEDLTSEGSRTIVDMGSISTCSETPPHYKLKARYIEIKENDYLLAKDVVFYLLEIPLFYQPIFFTSLSDKPQPFSVEVGVGDNPYLKTSYNVSYPSGLLYFSTKSVLSGDLSKELNWNHKMGSWSINLDYKESTSHSVLVKIFDSKNTFLFSQKNEERIYQFERKEKILNGSLNVVLKKESDGEDSYILPQVTVKKVSVKTGVGTFSVDSFNHETRIEDQEKRNSGSVSLSFRSVPFLLFQSVSVSTTGKYLFENQNLDERTSYLKTDSIWDFQNLSLGKFLVLDDKIYAGVYRSNEDGYRVGNLFTTTLRVPLGPFSFESYYKLFTVSGENLRKFSQNESKNEVDLKVSFSYENFKSSLETTYDFLEKEFSDPYLKTSYSFKTGDITHTVDSTTRFVLDEISRSYTTWNFQQRMGAFLNRFYFTYYYREPHVKYVEDQMRIYGKNFLFMENPRITTYTKLSVDPFELDEFWIRGTFKKGESTHSLKMSYSSDNLEFSYQTKNGDPALEISFSLKDWNVEKFSLSVEKALHCLGTKISTSFGRNFTLESFSILFFIRDFPNSGIGFDTEEGIGLNVF